MRPILMALLLATIAIPALAHDWYHTLRVPGSQTERNPEGYSCCDNRDCAPTLARHNGTEWEAETPTGQWTTVPQRLVIHDKTHPSGSAVLCWQPIGGVICFVPPQSGG